MGAAYREPDWAQGEKLMQQLIDSVSHVVPAALGELVTLGQTLKKRAADVLAYFNHPGTSNGPDRGDQRAPRIPPRLRPRVPQPHIARSLLETGGFRPQLHLDREEPIFLLLSTAPI